MKKIKKKQILLLLISSTFYYVFTSISITISFNFDDDYYGVGTLPSTIIYFLRHILPRIFVLIGDLIMFFAYVRADDIHLQFEKDYVLLEYVSNAKKIIDRH